MFVIRQLLKFIELLHSETSRNQLASGFVLGLFMGFIPTSAYLIWFLMVVALLWLRINFGAAFLGLAVFKIASFPLDPLFDKIGRAALVGPSAPTGLWKSLFFAPLVPYTYFYNSIVMGSLIVCALLAIPAFFFFRILIEKYRVEVVARIKDTAFWKAWKASKLFGLYDKYQQYKW